MTASFIRLVSAAGDNIPTLGSITLSIRLGSLQTNQSLVIVCSSIGPVILGLYFLCKHKLVVNFSSNPVDLTFPQVCDQNLQDFVPLFNTLKKAKICAIEALKEPTEEAIDDCAVPFL